MVWVAWSRIVLYCIVWYRIYRIFHNDADIWILCSNGKKSVLAFPIKLPYPYSKVSCGMVSYGMWCGLVLCGLVLLFFPVAQCQVS